jgi:hypothetical protein
VQHKSGGKRKAVLIGASIGAVIAAVALLIGALNQGGGTPSGQASPPSTSASSGATSSAVTPGAPGQTANTSTVDWGSAGQLVVDFYNDPASSWSMLTPAAQKVYGTEQAFKQYWSTRTIDSFSNIDAYKRANNADGSVDMRMGDLTVNGQSKALTLRVVSTSGGKLLIDSDTKAAG